MTDRTLLDRAALARRLGHSVEWLYNNLATLDGFPPPVLGNGRGARWDPRAIDHWLDRRLAASFGPQVLAPLAANDTQEDDFDRRVAELVTANRRKP